MALWGKTDALASAPKYITRKAYFDSTAVSTTAETINIISSNTGFATGDAVLYSINGGTVIGGLTNATTYFVRVVGAALIELYDTYAHAIAIGATTGRLNISGAGVGTHILQRTQAGNAFGDHNYNGRQIIFVDAAEARVTANRARGLNSPGWWSYLSYTDVDSSVRHKTELLIAIQGLDALPGNTGDASDDAIAADLLITIGTQPSNQSKTAPAAATFTVVATINGAGPLSYLWQADNGTGYGFRDFSVENEPVFTGWNTATLRVSPTSIDLTDWKVRCVVSATAADSVTSGEATLTVA